MIWQETQAALFAERPTRLSLQHLTFDKCLVERSLVVNVWRNHAFEPITTLIEPYAIFGRYHPEFRLSDYDDSLSFSSHQVADIELLWLDSERYLANNTLLSWLDWLNSRIRILRTVTHVSIIVAAWLKDAEQTAALQACVHTLPAVYFADMSVVCREEEVALTDRRSAMMAGTPVSKAAQPLLARKLACHWLPAAVFPPIKALALDLDHTLHAGVLGEDGIDGVQLTPAHQQLQCFAKALQQRGIFLALVSRNERQDVEALFVQRDDYPLRWNDFSAIEISWGDKASSIVRIAEILRIAPDAMLFVDDNPGELASVAAQLPEVHTVYAHLDASLTRRAIEYYPGLWCWKVEDDAAKRVPDIKANPERVALQREIINPSEYFRNLEVSLRYRYNPLDQLTRLAELCHKTNQFNLAMQRFSLVEISERVGRPDACVASVELKDRFAESGVISVLIAERSGTQLLIEELCISCRALGRHLENSMALLAIRDMPLFSGCTEVVFRLQHGPRNQPARHWLAKLLAKDNLQPGLYRVPAEWLHRFTPPDGILLQTMG